MPVKPLDFEPLAPAAVVPITPRPWPTWEKIAWFDLQWAHRAGTIALFALLASLAGAIRDQGSWGLGLAAAVVIADVGLIGGILAWWTSRRLAARSCEPVGVIFFNLIILLLAASIYAAGQFGYLHPALQWIINRIPAAS